MNHLFTLSMTHIKRAFSLLSLWNREKSFSSWPGMLKTSTATLPHALYKVFSESCSVRSLQDEGSEWKIQRSICYVPLIYPIYSLFPCLSLSLSTSSPHSGKSPSDGPSHNLLNSILSLFLFTSFLTFQQCFNFCFLLLYALPQFSHSFGFFPLDLPSP